MLTYQRIKLHPQIAFLRCFGWRFSSRAFFQFGIHSHTLIRIRIVVSTPCAGLFNASSPRMAAVSFHAVVGWSATRRHTATFHCRPGAAIRPSRQARIALQAPSVKISIVFASFRISVLRRRGPLLWVASFKAGKSSGGPVLRGVTP